MSTVETIQNQIQTNPILIYMKGSPDAPQCGFSAKVIQILSGYGHKFSYVDVLQNPEIRNAIKEYSNWPTFPQVYINGELIGGCDIVVEMHEAGELKPLLDAL